ncbi:protein phosphatase CheZ [Skermanella stibiiresistens]|uniref:protein phosphatase CheZ n=1 Tax=Skermanella stibiiresistens TaxID=913326 RepID=UPI0004AE1C44|nr:protein phosphatase CheZ [Skermanella stibiiresistens]
MKLSRISFAEIDGMSAKPFTAELQRRGLPFRQGALAEAESAEAPVSAANPLPTATPAEFMEAIVRIERRLDELAAIQPQVAQVVAAEVADPDGPDVADLQKRIQATQIEIAALRHPKAEQDRLVVAGEELAAIVSATEHATNGVLSAAELIEKTAVKLKARTSDAGEKADLDGIMDAVVSIFEACNFQDITGQRIGKVVRTLDFIEERVVNMIQTWGPEAFANLHTAVEVPVAEEAKLLNGPQLQGKAISQSEIDALFG